MNDRGRHYLSSVSIFVLWPYGRDSITTPWPPDLRSLPPSPDIHQPICFRAVLPLTLWPLLNLRTTAVRHTLIGPITTALLPVNSFYKQPLALNSKIGSDKILIIKLVLPRQLTWLKRNHAQLNCCKLTATHFIIISHWFIHCC